MPDCHHCGEPTSERYPIRKKWVSWGPCGEYEHPVEVPLCKPCRGPFLDERSRWYAVLDETMNTHAHFERVRGQDGVYVDPETGERVPCMGWQTAGEVGVPYVVGERYKEYC